MAAAFVQHLGAADFGSASTTTVLSISKTVTLGGFISVGLYLYGAAGTAPSATDNLGNTYTFQEQVSTGSNNNAALLTAPVTTGGTLTTITVTHASRTFRAIMAAEYSGVGSLSTLGGGSSGTGTTATWMTNKTIPANGIAIGYTGSNASPTQSAGSASGSPSTTITLDTDHPSGNVSIAGFYAIAGASDVTAFTGTSTFSASATWTGAGAAFSPSAATKRDPLGASGFFGV